jgi:uncharacterized protein YcfJ
MKRLGLALLLTSAALGVRAEPFVDHARVRSVEPQYENVNVPREECSRHWVNERRRVGQEHNPGGAIIGGVAGAVLGNQVGKGHGREAATALGAVVGAMTGDRMANRDRWDRIEDVPREVTTCRTVNEVHSRVVGYQVTYEYRGQQFTTLMRDNPGPTLRVRVSVDPV